MVLQDGLIANLDPAALEAVIAPKVIGAGHLDVDRGTVGDVAGLDLNRHAAGLQLGDRRERGLAGPVQVESCDIADRASVQRLLDRVEAKGVKLAGIIHGWPRRTARSSRAPGRG
jgi:hypothetical protein